MVQLTEELLKKVAEDYERDGFAMIEDFLTAEEVDQIRTETVNYVHDEQKTDKLRPGEVWGDPDKNEWYFQSDDSKTRLFYEKHAVDQEQLKLLTKPEEGMCKIGFALHQHRPFFLNFVRSKKITDLLRALDYRDPTLIQTMVNFKNKGVGGEFIPHQDSQYLTTTEPSQVVGFWFALDEATVENGCLDVIPGSHKWAMYRKYVRCKEGKKEDGRLMEWTGPMAVFDEKMYIKVPAKRGALVLIHGLLVHKSEPNRTDRSRWAFVFHAYDKKKTTYLDGWLRANSPAFVPIFVN